MTNQPHTAAGRALSRAWRVRRTASPGLEEAWPEQFDRYILAIEAEAATPALDVERLARALHAGQPHWKFTTTAFEEHQIGHMADAEAIAAEYARLSADEEGGT